MLWVLPSVAYPVLNRIRRTHLNTQKRKGEIPNQDRRYQTSRYLLLHCWVVVAYNNLPEWTVRFVFRLRQISYHVSASEHRSFKTQLLALLLP